MTQNLWPHQTRALEQIYAAWTQYRAPLLVLPTGAGKTRVACRVARDAVANGKSVGFVVHRNELVHQTRAALDREGVTSRVTVASAQSIIASRVPLQCDLLILDEARHYLASEWTSIPRWHTGQILGLDATPERADGRAMGDVFDALLAPTSVRELVDLGVLVPSVVYGPDTRKSGSLAEHPHVALNGHREKWKRAVVFCATVAQAYDVAKKCDEFGFRSAAVHSAMPIEARADVLARFRAGEIDVVSNVFILTEGFDDAAIDCVVLARGCATAGAFLQMVGRARRAFPGKHSALILDLAGCVHDPGIGMPDADRVYSLEGVAIREAGERIDIRHCLSCGAVYEAGPIECVRCGVAHPKPKKSKLSREALKQIQGADYSAAHSPNPDKRQAFYESLKKQAAAKGYKPAWAKFQFKARYNYFPKETA